MSLPEEITKAIVDSLTGSLTVSSTGPQVSVGGTHQVSEQWKQYHRVVSTKFNNVPPRCSFEMTIRPKRNEKYVPENIDFVIVLVFSSTPQKFNVVFELDQGEKLGE
jgi:hypothetical protein